MSADRHALRETRAAYPRLVPLTTRWGDNDVYGHVNNVVISRVLRGLFHSTFKDLAQRPV